MEENEENPEGIDEGRPPVPSETDEQSEIFACPNCGASVDADTLMCANCGVVFEAEGQTPSLDTRIEQMAPEPEAQEEQLPSEETQVSGPPPEEGTPIIHEKSATVSDTDAQISGALADYGARRRKRYLFGTILLGLGLVLFVLLWLVVVYDVLVQETQEVFGFDVILILVGAGIFFILGLYLILTYPKSSLADVMALLPKNVPARDSEVGSSET
ncbi:MAG: zinc ribbon domain-containing protein [Thermoplasmata archaeon]|nr:MAG: zinc ribbon domain-containing protein [Thermoplasmata archaeon]